MSKDAKVGAAAVTVGAVTAGLALATSRGWVSGAWSEALLLVGIIVVLFASGWIVGDATIAGLVLLAGLLFAPEPPPGLVRIARIMEEHESESKAPRATPDASP